MYLLKLGWPIKTITYSENNNKKKTNKNLQKKKLYIFIKYLFWSCNLLFIPDQSDKTVNKSKSSTVNNYVKNKIKAISNDTITKITPSSSTAGI